MAQSQLLNNSFNNSKLSNNFDNYNLIVQEPQSPPSILKDNESPSSDQVTQNSKNAICGICMKESSKDDLITCTECGLGGNFYLLLFLNLFNQFASFLDFVNSIY